MRGKAERQACKCGLRVPKTYHRAVYEKYPCNWHSITTKHFRKAM